MGLTGDPTDTPFITLTLEEEMDISEAELQQCCDTMHCYGFSVM